MKLRSVAGRMFTRFGIFIICTLLVCQETPVRADVAPQLEKAAIKPAFTKSGFKWPTLAKYEPPGSESVYHGASLPDTWSETGLSRRLQNFQDASGKSLATLTGFASIYNNGRLGSPRQEFATQMSRVKRMGAVSLIKFSTQDYAYNQTKRAAALKQISQSVFDAYFEEFADTVKEFGSPLFISIDHEMNGNWYPYSEAYPGGENTAADYVEMWRHIVNLFRRRGAHNVAWVWSPSVTDVGAVPAAKYYPGDDYVDWVGVSFYSSNRPTALDSLYRAYSQRKPFFITEWATAPEKSRFNPQYPGDVLWIDQFFQALETRYRRVKAISWFEWSGQDGNYLLQRNPLQMQAYARHIQKPRYIGNADGLIGSVLNRHQ